MRGTMLVGMVLSATAACYCLIITILIIQMGHVPGESPNGFAIDLLVWSGGLFLFLTLTFLLRLHYRRKYKISN